jgi:hypothetical protein
MKFNECNVGDKIQIIGNLENGCMGADCKIGVIISYDRYCVSAKNTNGLIVTASRLNDNFIGFLHVEDENAIWKVNNTCEVKLIKKADKGDKNMKDFKIKNYNVCENNGVKTVVVEFEDGSREHAVCNKDDIFELERGIEVCVLKHLLGADKYKASIKEANRQIKAIDREAAKAKKAEEESKEITKRRRAKAAKRKMKQRERRIAEMKEAYVAALRECGLDLESHNDCDCGGKCDCGGWDILK